MILAEDLRLFDFADDPADALRILQERIDLDSAVSTPAIAKSTTIHP
jgi:hypothetical protein